MTTTVVALAAQDGGKKVSLEVGRYGAKGAGPTLVLLHEGLGCVAMWKGFPEALAAETGLEVVAYSREGYGGSSPCVGRPLDYLRVGGVDELARLLAALEFSDVVLVGHSDGASIALAYAARRPAGLRGVVAMAPHTFLEEETLASIRKAKVAYQEGELRERLATYHGANVDGAFWGWNDMWLDPAFSVAGLAGELPKIQIPMLVIQGRDDEYGTVAQVDLICEESGGKVKSVMLRGCGHSPHRDSQGATVGAISLFVKDLSAPSS